MLSIHQKENLFDELRSQSCSEERMPCHGVELCNRVENAPFLVIIVAVISVWELIEWVRLPGTSWIITSDAVPSLPCHIARRHFHRIAQRFEQQWKVKCEGNVAVYWTRAVIKSEKIYMEHCTCRCTHVKCRRSDCFEIGFIHLLDASHTSTRHTETTLSPFLFRACVWIRHAACDIQSQSFFQTSHRRRHCRNHKYNTEINYSVRSMRLSSATTRLRFGIDNNSPSVTLEMSVADNKHTIHCNWLHYITVFLLLLPIANRYTYIRSIWIDNGHKTKTEHRMPNAER